MAKKAAEIVNPLNIDHLIGAPLKNRVVLMGVELEGGWKTIPKGVQIERDGSVFHDAPIPGVKIGELPLGPFQLVQLSTIMRKYFPQVVDSTCGMHVHMSFEDVFQYSLLMVPEFPETIIHYLTKWAQEEGIGAGHCLWPRLKGNSEFCQNKFWPDLQASQAGKDYDKVRPGHRYTIVHYAHRRKNTIEVRVLPMFEDVERSIRAVRRVVDITNASLSILSKQRRERGKAALDGLDDVYEEKILSSL